MPVPRCKASPDEVERMLKDIIDQEYQEGETQNESNLT